MAYYSGEASDIMVHIKLVTMGDNRADSITEAQVQSYQQLADDIINSKLIELYEIPLRQITRSDMNSGDAFYPPPIPLIARKLAAGMVVQRTLQEIAPNITALARKYEADALRELDDLVRGPLVGSTRLLGQELKSRNRFVNPYIAPSPVPPSSGGTPGAPPAAPR